MPSKTDVWWSRVWLLPTVSNATLRWPITDQLALSSSILPRVTHAEIVWQPHGESVYCLNLVYKVEDILFKHVVIGQPENWVKLKNISNRTHSTVQSIRATGERWWQDGGSDECECGWLRKAWHLKTLATILKAHTAQISRISEPSPPLGLENQPLCC